MTIVRVEPVEREYVEHRNTEYVQVDQWLISRLDLRQGSWLVTQDHRILLLGRLLELRDRRAVHSLERKCQIMREIVFTSCEKKEKKNNATLVSN